MAAGGDLTDPVTYSEVWRTVAYALPVLVVGWYVGVTWWTRDRETDRPRRTRRPGAARRAHLKRLNRLEASVKRGELSPREAHLEISAIVRSFISAVGPVDARAMSLTELRATETTEVTGVAEVVALVYPPAFQPGEQGGPNERLAPALRDARVVVADWRP